MCNLNLNMTLRSAILCIGAFCISPAQARPLDVVVTVPPIHSLVAALMDGVDEPVLLLQGGQTPHTYSLTPSDAKALSSADLVVWVGESLETFLERPLATLAADAVVIELAKDSSLSLLENREGGIWENHDDHAGDSHEDDEHEAHDHTLIDGHVWLNPNNAKAIVEIVSRALSDFDPANASLYAENKSRVLARLERLDQNLHETLAPVREQPFLTAHDALQYFDTYFQLAAVGAFSVSPDRAPSAQRLSTIRERVALLGSVCLFSEPGYEPRVMRIVEEAAEVRTGVLDPLGLTFTPGADLYFDLMTRLANSLAECLRPEPG